ncbi:MAG TPA: hypothetical protein VF393_04815 [archaeon]
MEGHSIHSIRGLRISKNCRTKNLNTLFDGNVKLLLIELDLATTKERIEEKITKKEGGVGFAYADA